MSFVSRLHPRGKGGKFVKSGSKGSARKGGPLKRRKAKKQAFKAENTRQIAVGAKAGAHYRKGGGFTDFNKLESALSKHGITTNDGINSFLNSANQPTKTVKSKATSGTKVKR